MATHTIQNDFAKIDIDSRSGMIKIETAIHETDWFFHSSFSHKDFNTQLEQIFPSRVGR